MTVTLKLRRTGPHSVPLPAYQTPGSAGLDLCAALAEPVRLAPGERRLIPTGLIFELPEGYEAQVRPRSGLALKHGLTIVNSPGTIDSDYRGEVGVVLINHGHEPFVVEPLSRIAQVVIAPVVRARVELTDSVTETTRGAGGYGSTGTT
jgi:dUTP pyrophosphatase